MRIGIFSKLGSSGGSEFRAAEMANLLSTQVDVYLLCEQKLSEKVRSVINEKVVIFEDVMGKNFEKLYDIDTLFVINSDSYVFSKRDYWEGKTDKQKMFFDLSKLKQFVILYNFVLDPAKYLPSIAEKCPDVRIIPANKHFFNEITTDRRFEKIRTYPRIFLESPIDPNKISTHKTKSDKIRIGRHSKSYSYKFNKENIPLILRVNDKFEDLIVWDFLGIDKENAKSLDCIDNVIIREEFSIPVTEYLSNIDIFLFFIDWDRVEPWSRSVAEGLISGCPVLANNKAGNKDQIISGNNGYLCNSTDEFYNYLVHLIENRDLIQTFGRNAKIYAREFSPQRVLTKFLDFIR